MNEFALTMIFPSPSLEKKTLFLHNFLTYKTKDLRMKNLSVSVVRYQFYTDKEGDIRQYLESNIAMSDRIDWALSPFMSPKKKLLLLDMDGTIVANETLNEVAGLVGKKQEIQKITKQAMAGELNFEDSLRERVALLTGIPFSTFREIENKIIYNPGIFTLVNTMQSHGAYIVLVSGGFKVNTSFVKQALNLDEDYANNLVLDKDGLLTGELAGSIVTPERKKEIFRSLQEKKGITSAESMAIGDGANDIPMLKEASLGIAYYAKDVVQKTIGTQINHSDFKTALYYQGYSEEEFVMS